MKFKYKGTGQHIRALLHMIGELQYMNGSASIADIVAFMGVTKTTAIKRLNELAATDDIIMTKYAYRPNAEKYAIYLSPHRKLDYENKFYKSAYLAVSFQVFNNA